MMNRKRVLRRIRANRRIQMRRNHMRIETIGRFTVDDNNKKVTPDPDDFFAPQLRNLAEVKLGEDLTKPFVQDNGGQSLPVVEYFKAKSILLQELAHGHKCVVFCSRGVLRKFALLTDVKLFPRKWRMQLQRRVHNDTTIVVIEMLDDSMEFNNNSEYFSIGSNLERLLITADKCEKRYVAQKLTLTFNNQQVPIYYGAEIDGFEGETAVEIKAKHESMKLGISSILEIRIQNYFADTKLTVVGYHDNGILKKVKKYTDNQLKSFENKENNYRNKLSLNAAKEKVENCLKVILRKIETSENRMFDFFIIQQNGGSERFFIKSNDTIPHFSAWFLK